MAKNELIITDGLLSKVRTLAAMGYSDMRVCRILDVCSLDRKAISSLITEPGTDIIEAYQSGKAEADLVIDTELTKKAECGDIDSLEALDKRKVEHKANDIRLEYFGV